ncbi:MAG: MarC family protein [Candidatus Anstonellaceae archaeon]
MDLSPILSSFIALFIVMDPFSSVPVFMSLTRKYSQKAKQEAAKVATVVAAGVFLGFLLFGPLALSFLGIRFESFQIAGGLLMLLIAIMFSLGIEIGEKEDAPVEAVIIGVPLLSGPGTMLTSMLLANNFGFFNVAIAGILACAASYAILLSSSKIYSLLGKNGLEILSRVMGVLLAAFAIEYIRKGFGL